VSPVALSLLSALVVLIAAWRARLSEPDEARWVALVGAVVALLASIAALLWSLGGGQSVSASLWGLTATADRLSYTLAPSVSLSALAVIMALPRRVAHSQALSRALTRLATTLLGLIAGDLLTVALAETLSGLVPALSVPSRPARVALWVSLGLMWLGVLAAPSLALPAPEAGLGALPLTLFLAAAALRLGVPPLSTGLLDQLSRGLCASSVLLAAPLGGVVLLARVVHPGMHAHAEGAQLLTTALLALALLAALTGITQRSLGRALGCSLAASHTLLMVGLIDPRSAAGFTGGELLWSAMLLAEVGLVLVYALVEARVGALSLHTRHGLSDHMPKLARAGLLLSLSAAALPGSLDFIAVELLLSGEATHSVLGALLMSSALSALAFGIVRVHFRVFFGPPSLPNARLEGLPRELVGLSLLLAALLAGGLAPSLLPLLRAAP